MEIIAIFRLDNYIYFNVEKNKKMMFEFNDEKIISKL